MFTESYSSKDNHILLECKVSGQPKPNVYWQKDNCLLPLDGSKYTSTETSDGVWQFLINNPTKDDSGLYTCYAESEGGQMKISKFVDVSDHVEKMSNKHTIEKVMKQQQLDNGEVHKQESKDTQDSSANRKQKKLDSTMALHVESKMKAMFMPAGNKAQLICYVSGFIEDVYWLRGGERITKNMRHKIYNINGAISLEIYDARPDDTGEYKCVIKNSKNSVDCSCMLTVYDDKTGEIPKTFLSPISGICWLYIIS